MTVPGSTPNPKEDTMPDESGTPPKPWKCGCIDEPGCAEDGRCDAPSPDESNRAVPPSFHIEWGGSCTLSVREVWPDGDAPKDPTTEDVVRQMLRCRSLSRLMDEWMFDTQEVEVSGPGGHRSLTDHTFNVARRV